MMDDYSIPRPIIDEPVEDLLHERGRIREFNTRLRPLFETEQENEKELRRTLASIQHAMDGPARTLEALEKEYDDSLDLLAKERAKEARVKPVDPVLAQPYDERSVLNAHGQAERNVADMIMKKKNKATALDQKLRELNEKANTLAQSRDNIIDRWERDREEWERLIGENAAKEAQCDKLEARIAKIALERDFLADKMARYGDKGVDAYFENLFNTSVEQGVKALDAKYSALQDEILGKLAKEYEQKLQETRRHLDSAADHKRKLEEECEETSGAIRDGAASVAEVQRLLQEAEQEVMRLQGDIRAKEREIQAATAMLKSIMQDEANIQSQLDHSNKNIAALNSKLKAQQNELDGLVKHKEDKDRQVSKELAVIKAERDKLLVQLEGSRIFVGPEIDKYETLLGVAEMNLGSARRSKRARRQ